MFFWFNRSYSVTLMLAELSLECFENLMFVNKNNFLQRWSQCTNLHGNTVNPGDDSDVR